MFKAYTSDVADVWTEQNVDPPSDSRLAIIKQSIEHRRANFKVLKQFKGFKFLGRLIAPEEVESESVIAAASEV